MAQFLLTELLGLPTLDSIISDISPSILEILEPIYTPDWIQPNWMTLYTSHSYCKTSSNIAYMYDIYTYLACVDILT